MLDRVHVTRSATIYAFRGEKRVDILVLYPRRFCS